MMFRPPLVLVVLILLGPGAALLGAPGRAKEDPPDKPPAAVKEFYPREVAAARQTMGAWLKEFLGKKQADIEKQLGPPNKKATYKNADKDELVLRYDTPDQDVLQFYFLGERVITVSFHQLLVP